MAEEIEKDQVRLERIREDWAYINEHLVADANGLRPNPVRLDNFDRNDDPEAIGLELVKMNKYKDTLGHYIKIGSLLKFDILIRTDKIDDKRYNRFYIEGACKYTYNSGHLADTPELAVTNFIRAFNRIPDLMEKITSQMEEQQDNISAMQKIVNTPWRKEVELRQMKTDLAVLERKIKRELEEIGTSENIQDVIEIIEKQAVVI